MSLVKASLFTVLAIAAASCVVGPDGDGLDESGEELPDGTEEDTGEPVDRDPTAAEMADPEWEGDEPELEPVDEAALTELMPAAAGAMMRVCNATALNQRTGAATTFSIVQVLPADAQIKVIESANGWVKNEYNGKTGFSSRKYLCEITATDPDPDPADPVDPDPVSNSESVSKPYGGSLRNAVRIAPHPGYVIAKTGRGGEYGTAETMRYLRGAFDAVQSKHAGTGRAQIRDISVARGGRPASYWPHKSHQSGRDVDITYFQASCSSTDGCPPENSSRTKLLVKPTWTMLEYWLTRGVAYKIFIDSSLHGVLKTEAAARGHSAAKIKQWFGGVIAHAPNHLNHLHVRFVCPRGDGRCAN